MAFDLKKALMGESAKDRLKAVKRKLKDGQELNFALLPAGKDGIPILIYSKTKLNVTKAVHGVMRRAADNIYLEPKPGAKLTTTMLKELNKGAAKAQASGIEFFSNSADSDHYQKIPTLGEDAPKAESHYQPIPGLGQDDADAQAYAKVDGLRKQPGGANPGQQDPAYQPVPADPDDQAYASVGNQGQQPAATQPPPNVPPSQPIPQTSPAPGASEPKAPVAKVDSLSKVNFGKLKQKHKTAEKAAIRLRKAVGVSLKAVNDRAYKAKLPDFRKAVDALILNIDNVKDQMDDQLYKSTQYRLVAEVGALLTYALKQEAFSQNKYTFDKILQSLDAVDGDLATVGNWIRDEAS